MGNIDSDSALPLGPPPRKARFRLAIRNLRRAYRAVFALVILLLGGWALLDGMRLYDLAYGTVAATGKITKKEIVPRGASRDHRLEYSFTAGESQLAAAASVPTEVYETAVEGGTCNVVYMRDHPAESWLNNNEAARTYPRFMMICRGLGAVLALAVLLWIERPLRRDLVLARRGEVAQGQILATGKGRRKRARAWIKYAFSTAGGVALQGRCVVPRATPAEARAPGATIEVLYDPRNPSINKARPGLDFVEFL